MLRGFLRITVVIAGCAAVLWAQGPSPAIALEPISAILAAFESHTVVALSEGSHNNEQGYEFRLALIRDRRFRMVVNDIVVESGTSKHQDIMDRFIRGESVPDAELRRAWQDTTQPDPVWDAPMYEEFFRAVRAVNASLPRERQLRVLLGDPPFDWDNATRDDRMRVNRDGFAATIIQREVLAKQRRALVIYGNTHFLRRPPLGGSSMVTRLAASCGSCVFNIWTHTSGRDLQRLQSDIVNWRAPALALTKDTTLGAAPFGFYFPGGNDGPRMDEQFDAVLYLGPVLSIVNRRGEISRPLCADAEYMRMRLSRMDLTDAPPNAELPPGFQRPSDRLRQYCAKVVQDDEATKK